ncbi:MAG TPA: DinB family protein [Tepidisphaeraceae bacterium]|nr:DinB family protein [Tepidisphaeraceae bacterium]
MNRELIEQYAHGGEKLSMAIRSLTPADLLCPPDPTWGAGKWSIQQVVVHCMDSELVSADRLKRMIAEDNPTLMGYDENKFVAALMYDEQPAEQAIALVDANRKLLAGVLRKLPENAFARKGTHNERGELTVGGYLKSVVDHLEHHIRFIHAKRAKMGKEMW